MKNNAPGCAVLSVLFALAVIAPGAAALYGLSRYVYAVSYLVITALCIYPLTAKKPSLRLTCLSGGTRLLTAFLITLTFQLVYTALFGIFACRAFNTALIVQLITAILSESLIFWCGIISVYATCGRIGVKWRALGIAAGFVFPLNIIVLMKIISLANAELSAEDRHFERNAARRDMAVCRTKYPLLLVHGVFFRDSRHMNYWGRIPQELCANGASVYYGGQQSALGIDESARELASVIEKTVIETGCVKLNVIAHSKGGLDVRCAMAKYGSDNYIASLTTVNTPHRGCAFADWLFDMATDEQKKRISSYYNAIAGRLGDKSPDFLASVSDLRASYCEKFNAETPYIPGIYCQSVGSSINKPFRGVFPLCFSYMFVKHFDGDNDGLVNTDSESFGERFIRLKSRSPAGISHADVIDLSRHDTEDFDVREFYVSLVSELKNKGL